MLSGPLHDALVWQARLCAGMGAPLTSQVLQAIAEQGAVAEAFAPSFAPLAHLDVRAFLDAAHPLRLLGALHFIVLTGVEPDLAASYAKGGGAGLADALVKAAGHHPDILTAFMASPPQTNEVRRSLCLLGGFLTVAEETRSPLRCLEIGASAGLNLHWDSFHYDLGALGSWGDGRSPVRLTGDWTGPAPPLSAPLRVAERRACDQNPLDIQSDAGALRLLAYIWPDQPERMERARAAIGVHRLAGVTVEKADAANWVTAHVSPKDGVATVLYHSVFWQYPPQHTRDALLALIDRAGAQSTLRAPFAWLRMEPSETDPTGPMQVRLSLWPQGSDRLLAKVHPHGATVDWVGQREKSA